MNQKYSEHVHEKTNWVEVAHELYILTPLSTKSIAWRPRSVERVLNPKEGDSWRHRRPRSVPARAPASALFVSVSFCLLPSPFSFVDMLATLVMEEDCVAQTWSSRSWFWDSFFLSGEAARRYELWRLGGGSTFRLRVWNPNFPFVLFMKLGWFWTVWRGWAWCVVSVLWS